MADLHVVQLRDGRPSLNDVSGQLRRLADRVDSGELGEVETLLVVIARDGDYPTTLGFGPVTGTRDPIIQFELAKLLHCQMHMGRT